jgi:hypothetical protein
LGLTDGVVSGPTTALPQFPLLRTHSGAVVPIPYTHNVSGADEASVLHPDWEIGKLVAHVMVSCTHKMDQRD